MREILYLIICVIGISCTEQRSETNRRKDGSVIAQRDTSRASSDNGLETVPKSVADIKLVYTDFVKKLGSKQLDSVVKHYDCAAEISGTVTYFYQDGKLRLLKHEYIEHDHFSATDQYFVIDDQLYFVYLNSLVWSFESNGAAEGATKDDITEERIYVVDGKPIECLEKKFSVRSVSKTNPSAATVPNKRVDCKPISSLLNEFKGLVAFKNQGEDDCMPKK